MGKMGGKGECRTIKRTRRGDAFRRATTFERRNRRKRTLKRFEGEGRGLERDAAPTSEPSF